MKTAKVKTKEIDYVRPGEPMTQAEFEAHIKEAETGSFIGWEQEKKEFNAWRKNLNKL